MGELHSLHDIGRDAVALARGLISSTEFQEIEPKGDRDMVTNVDKTVEREVRRFLSKRAPHVGFIGEEERPNRLPGYNWVLDPIDGTANFIHGLPLYSIALSLLHEDSIVAGLIDIPSMGLSYSSMLGCGAFLDGERISCSPIDKLSDAIVAVSDFSLGENADNKNTILMRVIEELAKRVQRVRLIGSAAISLAWVADGRLDAAVILSNEPWDTSAGILLSTEAGASAYDALGAVHRLHSGSAVAVNCKLEYDLVPLVSEAISSVPRGVSIMASRPHVTVS